MAKRTKAATIAAGNKKILTSLRLDAQTYEALRAEALKRAAPGERPNMGPIVDELVKHLRKATHV
jgi:hypothetical protein